MTVQDGRTGFTRTVVSKREGGLAGWQRVCTVLALWATTAITLSAQTFSLLHTFDYTDGAYPQAGLVQANNGNLYGTTDNGGAGGACFNGCGTVFKITPGGTLTTLYSFCSQSGCPDGDVPIAGLVQASNGNLYGATAGGGVDGLGTVFEMTPSGTLTTLYSFCPQGDCADGDDPLAGLVQANNGNFYGTTGFGGVSGACVSGCGTVFKITPSGKLTTLHS